MNTTQKDFEWSKRVILRHWLERLLIFRALRFHLGRQKVLPKLNETIKREEARIETVRKARE